MKESQELNRNLKDRKQALETSQLLKRSFDKEKEVLNALSFLQRYEQSLFDFLAVLNREIKDSNSQKNKILEATEELIKAMDSLKTAEVTEVTIASARDAITAFENALPSLTNNEKLIVAGSALAGAAIFAVLGFALGATFGAFLTYGNPVKDFWEALMNSGFIDALTTYPEARVIGSLMGTVFGALAGGLTSFLIHYHLEQKKPLIKEGQAATSAAGCIVRGFENHGWKGTFFNAVESSESSKNEFKERAIWRVKEGTAQLYTSKGDPNETKLSQGTFVQIAKSKSWDEDVKHPTTGNVMVWVAACSIENEGQMMDRWQPSLIDPSALEFVAESKEAYDQSLQQKTIAPQ